MKYILISLSFIICAFARPQAPAPASSNAGPPPPPPPPPSGPGAAGSPHPQPTLLHHPPPPSGSSPESSQSGAAPIAIVNQSEDVGVNGTFSYSFETANGIHVQQDGYIKPAPEGKSLDATANPEEQSGDIQVIQGSFSYTAPDGQNIVLKYVADENGFQPEGDHLPTTPAGLNPAPGAPGAPAAQNAAHGGPVAAASSGVGVTGAPQHAPGVPPTLGQNSGQPQARQLLQNPQQQQGGGGGGITTTLSSEITSTVPTIAAGTTTVAN